MASNPSNVNGLANYLATGYWQSIGSNPHHFQGRNISVDLTGLNGAGKALAREALDAWEDVANVRFQERKSGADITFSDKGHGAETNVKFSGGETLSADVNVAASWIKDYGSSVGTYGFQTYIHEIGHALGLGHSGNYNGGANFSQARFANDSWQTTVMSYFDQDENPGVVANKAYVVTPMMADIQAIQKLYGKPQNGSTDGKTTHGADLKPGNAITIYDQGGNDTIDLGRDNRAQDVNLAAGSFSDVFGLKGNLGIAKGTVIENLVAGSGNDSVAGNKVANSIALGRGDDFANGKGGNDKLNGGDGDDTLIGGDGQDSFIFAAGRDTIEDLENDRDTLVLDQDLWGGQSLSADRVLDYAHVEGGDVVFDFGGGDTLRIKGITDIDALADDLAFI